MLTYQTRRLLALREFRYLGDVVYPGQEFNATTSDAKYLVKTGKASAIIAGTGKFPFTVPESETKPAVESTPETVIKEEPVKENTVAKEEVKNEPELPEAVKAEETPAQESPRPPATKRPSFRRGGGVSPMSTQNFLTSNNADEAKE